MRSHRQERENQKSTSHLLTYFFQVRTLLTFLIKWAYPFVKKIPNKLMADGNFLNMIKGIHGETHNYHHPRCESRPAASLKIRHQTKTKTLTFTTAAPCGPHVLACRATNQSGQRKGRPTWKRRLHSLLRREILSLFLHQYIHILWISKNPHKEKKL